MAMRLTERTEKRPEHDAAEQIENGLGEEDVRGPGDAFVYRAEDAHAAEAEGGNKGDDVHDVRLIAAVLAFARRNSALMHLARKDSAKTSSPMTEPAMRAMTTTGSAEALFTRVEPMHSVITPKMRKRFLDALRDEPGEEGPGEPADEKSATVCNRSDHNA